MKEKYPLFSPIFWLGCSLFFLTIPLSYFYPGLFIRYFGYTYPPLVLFGALLLALLAQFLYRASAWGAPPDSGNLKRAWKKILLAATFALPSVGLDLLGTFARDINVPWPSSLFFYVIIAHVVETIFHLVPLALSYSIFGVFRPHMLPVHRLMYSLPLVASLEPVFQCIAGIRDGSPLWSMSALFVALYLFNYYQLQLFIKHGFLAMFGSRISYYLLWHILWGELRLPILFHG